MTPTTDLTKPNAFVLPLGAAALTAAQAAMLIPSAVGAPGELSGVPLSQVREQCHLLKPATWEALITLEPASDSWRRLLRPLLRKVTSPEAAVIGAAVSTRSHRLLPDAHLSGAVQRRIDAVLDVLDVPFSANDLQTSASQFASLLVDVPLPSSVKVATMVVGFVGGAHGVISAGANLQKGATWWLGRTETPADLVQHLIGGLTESAAFAVTAPEDWSPLQKLDATWLAELQNAQSLLASRRSTGSSEHKVLARAVFSRTAAIGCLRGLAPVGAIAHDQLMPDVTGHRLSDAKSLLALHGITVSTRDARSDGRWIASDSNWRVVEQSSAAGAEGVHAATLTVTKWSE